MDINDFLNYYEQGCFFDKVNIDKNGSIAYGNNNWKTYYGYIYLLVCNDEIIYIGQSFNIQDRLNLHKRKIKVDSMYTWDVGEDLNVVLLEEELAISYANPILNNTEYTTYESLYSGEPQSLEYVLGYVKLLDQLRNETDKKTIQNFIKKIS